MKKIFLLALITLSINLRAQNICNSGGNLMIFTNYDGGTLNINVNQNIPNLVIGICGYEATVVNLSGAFVGNVVGVRYAGYNGNNNPCGGVTASSINGAPLGATSSTVFAPASPISNTNGYGSIICGYSCSNNTSQGGCNTTDQIEAYFLNYFTGSSLFAHKVQYGCWSGTYSVSAGGSCCPPAPFLAGTIAASQAVCAGSTVLPLTSSVAATGGTGTINYQWQSSTTSPASGFTNISGATGAGYSPGMLSTTTYFRRGASTSVNSVIYSNVITVTIDPSPVVNINSTPSITVCQPNTVYLLASAAGATSYTWSGPNNFTSNVSNSILYMAPLSASGIYTASAHWITNTCVGTNTIAVSILPSPSVSATGGTFCVGQSGTVSATGAVTYTWSGPGAFSSNTAVITLQSLQLTSSGVYTVTGSAVNGCSMTATTILVVSPLPSLTLTANPSSVCKDQAITLSASGATTYSWNSLSSSSNATINALPGATTVYTVEGINPAGCRSKSSATVTVYLCTDLKDQQQEINSISIYPNPSHGSFIIIKGQSANSFSIINEIGQLVKTFTLNADNNYSASVTELPAGIYFILPTEKPTDYKQKIIIEK